MAFWIVFIFKFALPLTRFRLSLFLYSPSVKIACEVGGAYDLDHAFDFDAYAGEGAGSVGPTTSTTPELRRLRPRPL